MSSLARARWLPIALAIAACGSTSAQQPDPAAASADSSRVNASALRRTKIVNAVYPQLAKDNAITGMLELAFTIQPDGSTSDIVVINAVPSGYFEQSAIEALAQWRYEPVIRNGKAVAQPASVNIKFAL
jgi:TonB family protein